MDAITGFSYKPLRLSLGLCACTVFATIVMEAIALFTTDPLHTAALAIGGAVFLASSFVLLAIGVVGEYIGRIYDEVRDRPLSLISHVHRSQVHHAVARPAMAAVQSGAYAVPAEVSAPETVTKAA